MSDLRGRAVALVKRVKLSDLGPIIGLLFLFILGTIVNPVFLSLDNLVNVVTRTAFIGMIAVGATLVIITGGLDLSVGSMAAFISGMVIIIMNGAIPRFGAGWLTIVIGIASAVIIGLASGLVNGIIVTRGRISPFIVTLGTMGIFRSLITYLANGGILSLDFGLRNVYRPIYYGSLGFVPIPVLAFLAMAVVGTVLLTKTRFGRYCQAIGSNEQVAHYSAIDVSRVKLLTYAFQGLCVATAMIVYIPRLGSASQTTGLGWELEAIAAVIIGGTAMKGGSGRIWGSVVGALILSTIGNLLNLTSLISPYLNGAIQGAIIITAVLIQENSGRRVAR